jgi:hypothetical protein
VLLCCCAPAYADEDTVLVGGGDPFQDFAG